MANALNATLRVHGGNDLLGQPEIEFSSNANACGPCPTAVRAIEQVDPSYYPESGYLTLRRQLANFHGVGMDRLLIAASGSEFITRITAMTSVQGRGSVWLPKHAYADYATAANAYQLPRAAMPEEAGLVWCCDPTSPLGQTDELLARVGQLKGTVALDRAYEPLRLEGALPLDPAALDKVWQLWTPNKVLGLPGIRAAYAIAPVGAQPQVLQMQQLAASVAARHPRHRDAGIVDDRRNPGLGEKQPEHAAPMEGAADRAVHIARLRVPAQPRQFLHRAAAGR